MKILYAIQGTGNGHLSRAADIIPCLRKHGEVDILVSGISGDIALPFPIKYKLRGLSFIFGKSGGVDLWKTFAKSKPRNFMKSVNELPVEDYDLVINDFEPVSAWACSLKKIPCVALSHQAAVLNENFPHAEKEDRIGHLILENYAPSTAQFGFHFKAYDDNIFSPVIRKLVRDQYVTDNGHYTVYLPAYDDKRLIKRLSEYPDVEWDVFSKHNTKTVVTGNITIQPINNLLFTASMASSSGVLCGAGFETPAEAMFLGKKLLVIPMKNQYEQQLNSAALSHMNVPVIKSLKSKYRPEITEWIQSGKPIRVNYPDMTQRIVDLVVAKHGAIAKHAAIAV